jgi:hypothetical protein
MSILLGGACFDALLKLSSVSRWLRLAIISLILLSVYFMHPWAAAINIVRFKEIMNDSGTLNTSCSIIILQAITCILFLFCSLNPEKSKTKQFLYRGTALLPSLLFPVSIFISMVAVFNSLRLIDFNRAALLLCGALAASLFMITEAFSIFIGRKLKNELIFSFQLLMIFTGMFFPVILNGRNAAGRFPEINASPFWLIIYMALASSLSAFVYCFWEKRKRAIFLKEEKAACANNSSARSMEAFQ